MKRLMITITLLMLAGNSVEANGLSHYQRTQLLEQGYSNGQINQLERNLKTMDDNQLAYELGKMTGRGVAGTQAARFRERSGVEREQPQQGGSGLAQWAWKKLDERQARKQQEANQARQNQEVLDRYNQVHGGGVYVPPHERAETESERNLRLWKESQAAKAQPRERTQEELEWAEAWKAKNRQQAADKERAASQGQREVAENQLPPLEQHPLYEGAIQELMAMGMDREQAAAYIQAQLVIRGG